MNRTSIFYPCYLVHKLVLYLLPYFIVVTGLMSPVTWLLGALNSRLGHLYQPFNIRVLHLTIIMSIVVILFFAVRSLLSWSRVFCRWCFFLFKYFHMNSDTNSSVYVHGRVVDYDGCSLLLFHFIDNHWVSKCTGIKFEMSLFL